MRGGCRAPSFLLVRPSPRDDDSGETLRSPTPLLPHAALRRSRAVGSGAGGRWRPNLEREQDTGMPRPLACRLQHNAHVSLFLIFVFCFSGGTLGVGRKDHARAVGRGRARRDKLTIRLGEQVEPRAMFEAYSRNRRLAAHTTSPRYEDMKWLIISNGDVNKRKKATRGRGRHDHDGRITRPQRTMPNHLLSPRHTATLLCRVCPVPRSRTGHSGSWSLVAAGR